jgi:hypothetical protein
VNGAVGVAVNVAVGDAVNDAVRVAVGDAVNDAVGDAVNDAVGGAVRVAVGVAVNGAVGDAVNGAVGVAVRDAVDDAVNDAVGGAVRVAVGVAVNGAVGVAVRDAVDVAVNDAVGGAVGGAMDVAVKKTIRESWWRLMGGQFWVGWWWGPAYASFMTDVAGLELEPKIATAAKANRDTCESACWWWPHKEFVMVCERPTFIGRDDRGRLHADGRMSIEWPDGWGLYHWHGVRVPAHVITAPATITVAEIEAEQNAETRRVMVERYGQARYLVDSGAKQVHRDSVGVLYRKEIPGDEPLVMVKVRNSTPEPDGTVKDYFLRVPPQIETARAGVAWTFGLGAKDYRPEAET